ncbi:hypothetical protein ACQPZX_08460 [Actinoplanes sp. CA-142083]|uniref:hypothetical protein n=1 Tax=Actinoplanes sp. CA-142083 TaxID=3239903 RepID=UPI003D8B470D
MRIARLVAVVALPAALLVTAACDKGGVQTVTGTAGPVTGSPSPSVTSAATTSEPTSPPASASASATPTRTATTAAALRLGPNGYGKLKLGMTADAASATGLIDPWVTTGPFGPGCVKNTHLKASGSDRGFVMVSSTLGVEIIDAYDGSMRTPEGIHLGSTAAALFKAYPDWKNAEVENPKAEGRGYAAVPGNDKATYRIVINKGKVVELTLQYKNQDCYE